MQGNGATCGGEMRGTTFMQGWSNPLAVINVLLGGTCLQMVPNELHIRRVSTGQTAFI